jgi:hypothetical protein
MRCSAFVSLLLVSAAGLAADDDPVKAPYVEVGDCWSYRARNIDNRGPIDEYEECITFVDRGKKIIFAVAKVKADGREIDTTYSTEWMPRTAVSGLISAPTSQDRPARFPLRVGDTFQEESEFRRALLGAAAGKSSIRFKATGWEEVTVPAGKFRAMKIEGSGTGMRYDTGKTYPVKMEFWHVPEIRRYVKLRFQSPAFDYGVELSGYRLNQ